MEAPASASTRQVHGPDGALLVLTIIGSSVLAGIGLLGVAYWLLTQRWLYFLSILPLIGGAYLLFTRASGPDHA